MVAAVFFALGRRSIRPALEQDAARARLKEQIDDRVAPAMDLAAERVENQDWEIDNWRALYEGQEQPNPVRVVPLNGLPGMIHSEWGQWPELQDIYLERPSLEGSPNVLRNR